jgi:hypothetical protein
MSNRGGKRLMRITFRIWQRIDPTETARNLVQDLIGGEQSITALIDVSRQKQPSLPLRSLKSYHTIDQYRQIFGHICNKFLNAPNPDRRNLGFINYICVPMRGELANMIAARERRSTICQKQCRDNGSGHFSHPGCPIPSVMGRRVGQSFDKTRRKPADFLIAQEKEAMKPQNEAYMDKSKFFPYCATQRQKEELSRSLRGACL